MVRVALREHRGDFGWIEVLRLGRDNLRLRVAIEFANDLKPSAEEQLAALVVNSIDNKSAALRVVPAAVDGKTLRPQPVSPRANDGLVHGHVAAHSGHGDLKR